MEAIAEQAGVGVGTLYRHFPRRIDVVEAVYRTDVDQLVSTAEQVAAELEPWPALVSWLRAFVRYTLGKRTFLNELHEAFDKNPQLWVASREDRQGGRPGPGPGSARRRGAAGHRRQGPYAARRSYVHGGATLSEDQSGRLLGVILDGLRQSPAAPAP